MLTPDSGRVLNKIHVEPLSCQDQDVNSFQTDAVTVSSCRLNSYTFQGPVLDIVPLCYLLTFVAAKLSWGILGARCSLRDSWVWPYRPIKSLFGWVGPTLAHRNVT
jgi:hypothetical protein